MARRNRNRQDQMGNLLVHVQRRFADTPLKAIGEMLVNEGLQQRWHEDPKVHMRALETGIHMAASEGARLV